MAGKKSMACCLHNLRRMAAQPRTWAVLVVLFLFVENQFAPIRQMLQELRLQVGFWDMGMYMLADGQVTLGLALAMIMLAFDTPFTDESQRYIIIRAGRRSWALGQVLTLALSSLLLLVFFCLCLLVLEIPHLYPGSGWSPALVELVQGGAYEYYDTMLEYDPWLMQAYSPLGGFLRGFVLHLLAFTAMGFVLFLINLSFRGRLGFLPCLAMILMDGVMEEYFPLPLYYLSPLTLSRLTTLDYGDAMGRPPLWYGALFLGTAALVGGVLCVRMAMRKEIRL